MKKKFLFPAIAVFMGIDGWILRRWQLNTAFEQDTGLPISGAAAAAAMVGFTVLIALGCLGLALCVDHPKLDWDGVFFTRSRPLRALRVVAAALYLPAAALLVRDYFSGALTSASALSGAFFLVALIVLLCLSAAALLVLTLGGTRTGGILLPGFCACVWLIQTYHGYASDPVVFHFMWQLLAVVAVALAWYFSAGFAFGRPRPRLCAFFSLLAVALCLLVQAEQLALSARVLYAASALWFLLWSGGLISAAAGQGRRLISKK